LSDISSTNSPTDTSPSPSIPSLDTRFPPHRRPLHLNSLAPDVKSISSIFTALVRDITIIYQPPVNPK